MGAKDSGQLGKLRGLPIFGGALVACLLALWLSLQNGLESRMLFVDPTTALSGPFYTGFFSSFGIVLWAFAASACFTAWRIQVIRHPRSEWQPFLFALSFFNLYLMLDDLLLLHEDVYPDYLGLPRWAGMALVILLAAGLVFRFWKIFRRREFSFLTAVAALLILSIAVDGVSDYTPWFKRGGQIVEDTLKWMGLAGWSVYCLHVSLESILESGERACQNPPETK